jgi:peptidoglycan-associated lipoprotein
MKIRIMLVACLLAACASEQPVPVVVPAPAIVAPKAPEKVPAPQAEPVPAPAPAALVTLDPLNDPNSILAKRSVYYPFDVYVVQEADLPLVQAHAQYLSAHSDRRVRLEGNCDERGSTEYNLALGQRRADGVSKMLMLSDVQDKQLETVSYGEEKPRLDCHEEKCWKENRRTDLNYNAR